MAINMYLPDGRDFDDVFYKSNGGQTTGFKIADGTDIGNRYVAGNSGIATGYKNSAGVDLGSILGTQAPYTHTITVGVYTNPDDSTQTIGYTSGRAGSIYPNTFNGHSIRGLGTSTWLTIVTTTIFFDLNTQPTSGSLTIKRLDSGLTINCEFNSNYGGDTYSTDSSFFTAADVGKTIGLIITRT